MGAKWRQSKRVFGRLLRGLCWLFALMLLNAVFVGIIFITGLYERLPPLDILEDYRPRLPMRVFSAEGDLLGEFGEERRTYTRYRDFPHDLVNALLATEDVRFFEHAGVDFVGVMRAAWGYVWGRREGASTITMQVARNFYLRRDRTLLRKIVEVMLALRIERHFSKEQVLERYMNQIYLGHGSYGFTAAAKEYYDKELGELTISEIAVLAGLPKSPSGANPRSHPIRAKERQHHVLRRMAESQLLDEARYLELIELGLPPLAVSARRRLGVADYVAEEVRQIIFNHFGEAAYERGFRVYTTIQSPLQAAAVAALRSGLLAHEGRRAYPGAEQYLDSQHLTTAEILSALKKIPESGGLRPAMVTDFIDGDLEVMAADGSRYRFHGEQLGRVKRHLPGGKKPILRVGAVIRLGGDEENPRIVSLPGAQAALIALASDDGAVLAMVGGFDFAQNQFNHVLQARRQPGSSLKPFIYSAALEKGLTAASILPDTPIYLSAEETGSEDSWQPKNYDDKAEGPMTMRQALARSKNLATVQMMRYIGAPYARDYLLRFGFRKGDHPPYLTLALGAGQATPMEIARGYAVFANGGYLVHPYLIVRVEDYDGNKVVNELDYENRRVVIDRRNAFIMTSLLQSVIHEGTGRAALSLQRSDVAGKTGTTNDTRDAWFAGYGGDITAVAWVGYGNNKSLGDRETGARAALPMWRDFMAAALHDLSETQYTPPPNVIAADVGWDSGKILSPGASEKARQEYFYTEYLPAGGATQSLTTDDVESLF